MEERIFVSQREESIERKDPLFRDNNPKFDGKLIVISIFFVEIDRKSIGKESRVKISDFYRPVSAIDV